MTAKTSLCNSNGPLIVGSLFKIVFFPPRTILLVLGGWGVGLAWRGGGGARPPPPQGRHGQKVHSGFPPWQVDGRDSADARSSADACLSWQKVQGLEANRRRHRLTEPTTKALCHPPAWIRGAQTATSTPLLYEEPSRPPSQAQGGPIPPRHHPDTTAQHDRDRTRRRVPRPPAARPPGV